MEIFVYFLRFRVSCRLWLASSLTENNNKKHLVTFLSIRWRCHRLQDVHCSPGGIPFHSTLTFCPPVCARGSLVMNAAQSRLFLHLLIQMQTPQPRSFAAFFCLNKNHSNWGESVNMNRERGVWLPNFENRLQSCLSSLVSARVGCSIISPSSKSKVT